MRQKYASKAFKIKHNVHLIVVYTECLQNSFTMVFQMLLHDECYENVYA
jgi:hypothetical protein